MPMHSELQWSTATKTVAVPSARVVTVVVKSVPHIWSGRSGGDRPVVCLRAPWLAGALRRLQAVLAHHTAYALLRGADVLRPQLGPHLAVAFPVKGGRLQQLANLLS